MRVALGSFWDTIFFSPFTFFLFANRTSPVKEVRVLKEMDSLFRGFSRHLSELLFFFFLFFFFFMECMRRCFVRKRMVIFVLGVLPFCPSTLL